MSVTGPVFRPKHAERARQRYLVALKREANGPLEDGVRNAWNGRIAGQVDVPDACTPEALDAAEEALAADALFRYWSSVTYHSQTQMWDAVEDIVGEISGELADRYAALGPTDERLGTLELDDALEVPEPISNFEIHRQPGGIAASEGPGDLDAGLRMMGASLIYAAGKGSKGNAAQTRARFIVDQVRARFPDLKPRRLLELGCGSGVSARVFAAEFPDAEIYATDVAPAGLRVGHLLAEEEGTAIHFRQCDAQSTGYPDGHFDLIVSLIMFHETNREALPNILAECRRLLAPGGGMLHADVSNIYEKMPMPDRVMNDWQTRHNGEPFWTQFGMTNMRDEIIAAGFESSGAFSDLVGPGLGPGTMRVFGASVG